jgi:thiamine pyrophosphate-dependent acetolactate synthase large subunit-like protein
VIARSHRPLILAGRGAYESGAREAILELADRIGAPLTTTVQAHGMFAGLRQDLGIVGGFAFEETSSVVAGADCVLAVGASLNAWTTKHGSAFGDAHIIHVDLAPSRVGAVTAADTQVIGDAAATIGAFNQCLQHRGVTRDRSQWLSSAEQAGAAGRGRQYQMADEPGRIDPRHLMAELDAVFPAERCVVLDGGHFLIFPMLGLTVPDPRGFIFSQDFGAVGLGLPLGIGAALGAPDRRCLTIVGDGGLMFGVQELETAVRYQIPITVVVMNDNVLQAEALYLLAKDRRIEPVSFAGCDFASIARSFGAVGLTITRAEQIEEIKAASLKTQGPVVADVKINPNVIHNWLNAFGFAVASTA